MLSTNTLEFRNACQSFGLSLHEHSRSLISPGGCDGTNWAVRSSSSGRTKCSPLQLKHPRCNFITPWSSNYKNEVAFPSTWWRKDSTYKLYLFLYVIGIEYTSRKDKRKGKREKGNGDPTEDRIKIHKTGRRERQREREREDGEKKLDAFLLENWTRMFAEKEDINEIWKRWKAQFFQDIKSFIGHEIKNQQSGPPTLKSPWFSNDIRRVVRAKNRLFRRAISSGKEKHWRIYCMARNKATAARLAKASFLNQQAQILSVPNCPPTKWWSLAKDLCGINGKGQMTVPPLRNSAGKIVTGNGERANLLNNTYIHKNTCLNSDGFPIGPINITTSFTIHNFSANDVRKAVQSLPNKTSVGPDQISYSLLKEAGPGVVGPLTTLFNLSLTLNKVPDEWKEAIVSLVFKVSRDTFHFPWTRKFSFFSL